MESSWIALVARSYQHVFGAVTDRKGNSEFCFPEIFNAPGGKAKGNKKVDYEGNKTEGFLRSQSLSVLLYLLT